MRRALADDQPGGARGEEKMNRAWICIGLFMLISAASAADIGRLFFTPAERAQLDIARTQKKPAAAAAAPEAAEEETPVPQIVTYGGLVRRSDGKSLLWLNGRLLEEKEALAGSALQGRVRPDGAVALRAPHSGGSIEIKVGQSVELVSGKVAEGRSVEPPPKPASKKKDGSASQKRDTQDSKRTAGEESQAKADATASTANAPTSAPADKSRDSLIGVK
jgi:hypothetical protein